MIRADASIHLNVIGVEEQKRKPMTTKERSRRSLEKDQGMHLWKRSGERGKLPMMHKSA